MTTGSANRLSGFYAQLSVDGETLTYSPVGSNPIAITATVNRNVREKDIAKFEAQGAISFEPNGLTIVEFVRGSFQPVPGMVFADQFSYNHRVRFVIPTDVTWICYCTQSANA